ncbi:MAG: hypothetical protein J6B85_00390 [Lachnospiraceae bacterium]|nr:hypothetical protein [Lachnospiraceae bacterium]
MVSWLVYLEGGDRILAHRSENNVDLPVEKMLFLGYYKEKDEVISYRKEDYRNEIDRND